MENLFSVVSKEKKLNISCGQIPTWAPEITFGINYL